MIGGAIDLNHFDSACGPVIPKCVGTQRDDPQALCSTGAINVQVAAGRVTYKGLPLRADKRLSHGFQLLGSYAYSSNTGTNGTGAGSGFNLDNWFQNRGPVATDITHIVNLAGAAQLPSRFELGLNFSFSSVPPFSAYVGGIDFNGDGTKDDLLPGSTVNAFNRSMGRADLERRCRRTSSHISCGRCFEIDYLAPGLSLICPRLSPKTVNRSVRTKRCLKVRI